MFELFKVITIMGLPITNPVNLGTYTYDECMNRLGAEYFSYYVKNGLDPANPVDEPGIKFIATCESKPVAPPRIIPILVMANPL